MKTTIIQRKEILERLVKIGEKIYSKHNRITFTDKGYQALWYFEKIFLSCYTFLKLIPDSEKEYLDAATIASLARNNMDTYKEFSYITEQGLTSEEFKFRRDIKGLHYHTTGKEMLIKLGLDEEDSNWGYYSFGQDAYKLSLNQNEYFLNLDKGHRLNILKGTLSKYPKKYKVTCIDEELDSMLFNLFSTCVHAYSYGLHNSNTASEMHLDKKSIVFLSIEVSIVNFASLFVRYLSIRRKLRGLLDLEEINFIKKSRANSYIIDWHETIKIKSTLKDKLL